MKIYDESLENKLENPDLEKGKLVATKRFVAHHDEQPRRVRKEVMPKTIPLYPPNGLRREIEESPYIAAWDEYEDVQKYVPYTQEELDKIAADKKAEEDRLAAEAEAEKQRQEAEEQARKEAEEAAAAKAKQEAENAEKLARIDVIDAQVTYTALMTDTLIGDDSDSNAETEA